MFAGEGDAFRTNRRFKLVSEGMPAKRLSTAFDSVTLYGNDPDPRPDIYGKVGNSGVCIATLDDMKVLYSGLRPVRPRHLGEHDHQRPGAGDPGDVHEHRDRPAARAVRGRATAASPTDDRGGEDPRVGAGERARHGAGRHPEGGPGPEHLHLLHRVQPEGDGRHRRVLRAPPGAQLLLGRASAATTSPRPARTRSASSRSRSSNGFTFVEAYLARGMHIDDFAPNLSLLLLATAWTRSTRCSGRVARRIWAVAMRDRYGANERSQKLKYHVQTSGRSAARAGDRSSTTSAPRCRR